MLRRRLLKIGAAVISGAACLTGLAGNSPMPEIEAWNVTPPWCPAYAKIFPLDYLAGDYTICENLPGMMMMHTNSGKSEREKLVRQRGKSRLVLELPEFLRLEGVCAYSPVKGKYPRFPVTAETISRDGVSCRRYTVELDRKFGEVPPHWYKQQICLHAEPGSAGRRGMIRWAVTLGGKEQPERSCPVRVLPPWKPSGVPTESFFPMAWIAATTSDFHKEARTMFDYWSSLSKRVVVYDRRPRAAVAPDIYSDMTRRFERTMFLMYNQGMIDLDLPDSPQVFYSDIAKGKYRGRLPMNKLVDGRVVNSLPLWYMVEDPDGLYGKYLEDGFRGIGEHYPEIKELIWDYEYFNICYDDGSLERFGKFLGLDRPATFDEVRSHLKQFVAWKTILSCRLVDKVNAAMRKNLPGVRLVMCSTVPKPKKANNSALANAQRYSDEMVDAHLPMTYHVGTAFFDQVDFCTSTLKKPFIALNNPAERYSEWFDRYSPRRLKQNIVASAALRCGGFGFWPNDMLTGSYFVAVSGAFADAARAERFYREGKRIKSAIKVSPAVVNKVPVGDAAVEMPTCRRDIRYLVHELGSEKLLTVFNYSSLGVIVKVAADGPCGVADIGGRVFTRNGERLLGGSFFAEIPGNGYAMYRITPVPAEGETVPQEKIEAEVEALRRRNPFAGLNGANPQFGLKRHFSARYHMLEMNNGKLSVMVDVGRGGTVRGAEFVGVRQLMTGKCHLGKLRFIDATCFDDFDGFVFDGVECENGRLTAKFSATIPERPDEPHKLAGMNIVKRVSLTRDDSVEIGIVFRNPTKREMSVDFRLHNVLCAGESNIVIDGKLLRNRKAPRLNLYTRGGALSFLFGRTEAKPWSGGSVRLDARRQGVKYRWICDAPDFAGIFFNNNGFFTVEPLSGAFTLKPGGERGFRFAARVRVLK